MELRKDPITRSWVLMANGETFEATTAACPYCPGGEAGGVTPILTHSIYGQHSGVLVYPHPRPLYRIEGESERRGDGFYDRMRALGAHELIVEGAEHNSSLSMRTEAEIISLLDCWALRIDDLKRDARFKYITVFKNYGETSGQQIRHAHSELTATTFIPRRILYELRAAQEYYQLKERCVVCDIVRQEEQQAQRVVDLSPRYLAICPFASRVPYELWIVPRYHHASYEADMLRDRAYAELAGILKRSLARLEQVTDSYHLVLHTSPNTNRRPEVPGYWNTLQEDYHWHMEILPITEKRSKSYSIKEVYFSSMPPEKAAARLRELPASRKAAPQSKLTFDEGKQSK